MFRRLTACLLPVAALLLASCYSVTPARFNRGFITSGHCLEQVTDADGKLEQFEVKNTPMERLFTLYASPDASSVMFLAYFFHQDSERSGCGTGTADVVNRAAFLALDEPPSQARPHALALKQCLIKNDYDEAEKIYNELAKAAGVESVMEMYPDREGGFKRFHEFKYGPDGTKILHGLTRNFHPNGMISNECFFRNGKAEGEFREYTELGRPITGDED